MNKGFLFTTNTYNREKFNILIGRFALSNKCVRLIYIKILFVRVQSYFPLKQATSKKLTVNFTSKKENNFI